MACGQSDTKLCIMQPLANTMPCQKMHNFIFSNWCTSIINSNDAKEDVIQAKTNDTQNSKITPAKKLDWLNSSLNISTEDHLSCIQTDYSSHETPPNDEFTWGSWLKTCSSQSPATDQKAITFKCTLSQLNYTEHHQETDYAHHKHNIHHHHHHYHHHHHHYPHNNTQNSNINMEKIYFNQLQLDDCQDMKPSTEDKYHELEIKEQLKKEEEEEVVPHSMHVYPQHHYYHLHHHSHHHHSHHHSHHNSSQTYTNVNRSSSHVVQQHIIIDKPIIGDLNFVSINKHKKCRRCRPKTNYSKINYNRKNNSEVNDDDNDSQNGGPDENINDENEMNLEKVQKTNEFILDHKKDFKKCEIEMNLNEICEFKNESSNRIFQWLYDVHNTMFQNDKLQFIINK